MELDSRNILLWIISIANVALGLLIVLKDRKSVMNRSFGSFAIAIACWSFILISFRSIRSEGMALLAIKVSYVAAIFIAASFWEFAIAFTQNRALSRKSHFALWGTALVMSTLILLPSFLTKKVIYHPWGKSVILGLPEYILFFVYFMFFFFGGLIIVGKKLTHAVGHERLQLWYIFWSVLIAGTGGVIFNLFMPSPFFNEWRFIWTGPIFTFLIVLFITYAIAKHQLLNVKAIAAELLTIALIVGLGIELFFSASLIEALFQLIILIFVATSGVFLVRSVINEVKRREEMERLKNALEIAYAKLKELDQAKTDFLSMASHQLRSPLTVVRLGLGALMEGTFGELKDKRQMDAAQKMLESATRLINLIGEYLNVSRIELGKMKYDFKERDLCLLLKDVVEEYQPRAKQKGLTLTFAVGAGVRNPSTFHNAPQPPLILRGGVAGEIATLRPQASELAMTGKTGIGGIPLVKFDEEKMRHVIVNMIDNAIKYTPKGSIMVGCELVRNPSTFHNAPQPPLILRGGVADEIATSPSAPRNDSGDWLQFSVKDTGLGMEPEDIAVLFQKFRRTSSSNMRRREGEPIEGSGLGLHVAKMFVDKHGGRIWAESPGRGKGSTFYAALPLSGPPPLSSEEMGEGGKGVELPR